MNRFFLFFYLILSTGLINAQELNATVIINADQTTDPSYQVFKTLGNQLTEFVNDTKWTNKVYKNQERIDCNFVLLITSFDSDSFTATLQIQSSRPIYGSTYTAPIYNYNDRQFNFKYREFQPLVFNPNTFDSNLVSVIVYHIYTIIGLDADTFEKNDGDEYFEIARQIVNTAAGSVFKGWKPIDGNQSRYRYNEAILSNVFQPFRSAMYDYHRHGLDIMSEHQRDGKLNIVNAINSLKAINSKRPNSFLLRTFFDAKAEEIQRVFSGGASVDIVSLMDNLTKMAPTKRKSWSKIKF